VSAAKTFEQDLADLQAIMSKAGEAVIGLPVPTDAKLVWAAGEMPPARITTATTKWELEGRYMDKRGAAMWELVMQRLQDVERAVS
jgi:hypothetical protein